MLRRTWSVLALVLAAQGLTAPASAQPSETAVKAAFLPRFARYVTWPPSAAPRSNEPFILCVIGQDRFGRLLDNAVRTQSIDGRSITVRRMPDAAGASACHVAFVHGNKAQPVGNLLAAIGRKPVLTVTDASNGGRRGIIHFTINKGRVRFFIDQGAAQQRGLTVSSRLLALAIGVAQ